MPNNVDTLCSLALCYSEIDALPLAGEYLTKAIALNPSEPRAHQLLGTVRFKENRLDEAEAEIRRAIQLKHGPKGTLMSHYYLGEIFYARGDIQGAMREYQLELLNDSGVDSTVTTVCARMDQLEVQLRGQPRQDRQ